MLTKCDEAAAHMGHAKCQQIRNSVRAIVRLRGGPVAREIHERILSETNDPIQTLLQTEIRNQLC